MNGQGVVGNGDTMQPSGLEETLGLQVCHPSSEDGIRVLV
jgi:hypothetical protein